MAESAPVSRSRRRRIRRRRTVAVFVAIVVVGAGSVAALAATGDDGPGLRLASVTRGSVTQSVESSGTVSSSSKSVLSFPVSGSVTSVPVKVGDPVRKGQVLARLDATSLQTDVDSAESSLATAKQRLESDKSGQTSTGSNGQSGSAAVASSITDSVSVVDLTVTDSVEQRQLTSAAPASPPPTGSTAASATSTSALIKQIDAAQNAVIAAQRNVDTGQGAVDAAQTTVAADAAQNLKLKDAQVTACDPPADPSAAACVSARADYESFADTLSADVATLGGKIKDQDAHVTDLDAAITSLDKLVDQLQSTASSSPPPSTGNTGGSGSTGGTGKTSGSGSTGGTGKTSGSGNTGGTGKTSGSGSTGGTGKTSGSGNTGGSGSTGGTGKTTGNTGGTGSTSGNGNTGAATGQPASAAQLAADQAAIDAAAAQLSVAEQNLAAATLSSPESGTVAAVGLTVGTSSSGQTITIVGTGVQGVATSVPLAQIDTVKVGQPVSVAADGVSTTLHGSVESIGLLSTTSGSSTTFPVSVRLAAGSPHLFDGAGADVVITTGTAAEVLTVPNSAIHSVGSSQTVTVDNGGKTSSVRVTLGLKGSDVTQVASGLHAGQRVVLADLSQSLPGSSTSSSTTGTGGRFGGTGGLPNFGARAGG